MVKWCSIFIILIINCAITLNAQVIKKDTKIRFSAGMSNFSSKNLNEMTTTLQNVSFMVNPDSKIQFGRFSQHFLISADYETNIDSSWSYVITLEYHSESIGDQSVDYVRSISQAFNFEIKFIVAGLSLIYYHPVFNSHFGKAQLFGGAGIDLIYADLNVYHYFYEDPKVGDQTVKYRGFSYVPGSKLFVGFEIPFTELVFVQLQTGYSYRVIRDLSGDIEFNKPDPFDKDLFKKDNYNISGFWGKLGIAYLF